MRTTDVRMGHILRGKARNHRGLSRLLGATSGEFNDLHMQVTRVFGSMEAIESCYGEPAKCQTENSHESENEACCCAIHPPRLRRTPRRPPGTDSDR